MDDVCGEILIVDLPLLTGVRRTRRLLPLHLRRLFMLSFLASLSLVLHKNKKRPGKERAKTRVVKLILTSRELDPSRVRPPALLSRFGVPQPRERPAHWILTGSPCNGLPGVCYFAVERETVKGSTLSSTSQGRLGRQGTDRQTNNVASIPYPLAYLRTDEWDSGASLE